MHRKILFVDVALNISIVTMLLTVLLMYYTGYRLFEIHLLNNGYYSNNKCTFKIPMKTSTYDDIKSMYSKCAENTVLYKELLRYEDLRGVLIKGKINPPPVIEGRFFVESDFYNGHYYAVIGIGQKDSTFENNGHLYIDLAGKPHVLIKSGIFYI